MTARAYNTFVASVLSYIIQLEQPPNDWKGIEKRAITNLARGPSDWCAVLDLQHLRCGEASVGAVA